MLHVLRQASLAFVAVLAFAVLFNVPRRSLLACGVTGVMGYLAQLLARDLGATPAGAAFVGAAVVGLFGEIFARVFRLPATVFIVTGFLPLLPGVAATRAVIQLISGDYARGGPNAITAAVTAFAIAAGIGGLSAAARAVRLRHPRA
jgi:uncharacterized membrane protein YjjB (DUF3815 family)